MKKQNGDFYISDKENVNITDEQIANGQATKKYYGPFNSYREASIFAAFHHETPINGFGVAEWSDQDREAWIEETDSIFLPSIMLSFPDDLSFVKVAETAEEWLNDPSIRVVTTRRCS